MTEDDIICHHQTKILKNYDLNESKITNPQIIVINNDTKKYLIQNSNAIELPDNDLEIKSTPNK